MSGGKTYHIETLENELQRRMGSNPMYSLRSFARDLGVSPSWLSDFLKGKKGLSETKAKTLTQVLGLNVKESELFQTCVEASHSRQKQKKIEASKKFVALKSEFKLARKVSFLEQRKISNWYYLAILELLELEDCEHTTKWLAQKLQLPAQLVSSAIDDLIEMEWIKASKGRWIVTDNESESSYDVSSEAIKTYHRQVLEKAKNALTEQALQDREFLGMTLAFNRKDLSRAKNEIRHFQKEFAKKFYTESAKKDAVYHLSVQFFRFDKDYV